MNTKKVIICMSTYNGEKYLEEQLESLFSQTYKKIKIYVRDDGSTDGTIDILKKYEKKGKITLVLGKNLGYIGSFMNILEVAYKRERELLFCLLRPR